MTRFGAHEVLKAQPSPLDGFTEYQFRLRTLGYMAGCRLTGTTAAAEKESCTVRE